MFMGKAASGINQLDTSLFLIIRKAAEETLPTWNCS